jgi:hypothetical protein
MTTQAAASVLRRWGALAYDVLVWMVAFTILMLLSAVLIMPLGHMVFDYWTPKVQGLLQPASPVVKTPGGKR